MAFEFSWLYRQGADHSFDPARDITHFGFCVDVDPINQALLGKINRESDFPVNQRRTSRRKEVRNLLRELWTHVQGFGRQVARKTDLQESARIEGGGFGGCGRMWAVSDSLARLPHGHRLGNGALLGDRFRCVAVS